MKSRPRTSVPSPPRVRSLARGLAAALVACAVFPAAAEAQLTVADIDPDGALPGEPVAISGAGFGRAPEDLFCWVDTGDGGFPFEVTAAADGRIDAVLGAVPAAATGAVTVWRGSRHPLADRVVLSQGRLFSASEGEVFVSRGSAVGPAFSTFAGSTGTYGGLRVQGELRLDLEDVGTGGGGQRVRVTAVIETSGDSGTGSTGNLTFAPAAVAALAGSTSDSKSAGPAWAATLRIEADAPAPTAEALAAGLADVLEAQLGSVGLTARAEGRELVVGHALGLRAGFLHLTTE